MSRFVAATTVFGFVTMLSLISPGHGQVSRPPDTAVAADIAQEERVQLNMCREGLLAPEGRPEDRRRWARMLFTLQSEEASSLKVELLATATKPGVQLTLCEVIREQLHDHPNQIDTAFIDPLVNLLGAENADLRTAAGKALADFPGAEVPRRLGRIAGDAAHPLDKRLAAIDALAPNVHRREVAEQLVKLLRADDPKITDRVCSSLEPASSVSYGTDIPRWEEWWTLRADLDEKEWFAEQLNIYHERTLTLADQLDQFRKESRTEVESLTAQLQLIQRELYRSLSPEQRRERIVEWLDSPLSVVRLTALAIIKSRMADEGKRPEGDVLEVLLRVLKSGDAPARYEALQIAQNLTDPVVINAVLARVEVENEPGVRHALFTALGRLDSPEAIPALIAEIESGNNTHVCVREAAVALGHIARRAEAATGVAAAVQPLKDRYAVTPPADDVTRAALLSAMAGVRDPAFRPEFLEAVESGDARLLRPSIRGLQAIGDTSKLPRFRTLIADPDAQVRLAAVEAVAKLGSAEADIERLLTRLEPSVEPNGLVREAAWTGIERILRNRPPEEQLKAPGRLRDLPEYQLRYLQGLLESMPAGGDPSQRDNVMELLARTLLEQQRPLEAATQYRQLFDNRLGRGDATAFDAGINWLTAVLPTGDPNDIAQFVGKLVPLVAKDQTRARRMVDALRTYTDSEQFTADGDRATRLLDRLPESAAEQVGESWRIAVEEAYKRIDGHKPASSESP